MTFPKPKNWKRTQQSTIGVQQMARYTPYLVIGIGLDSRNFLGAELNVLISARVEHRDDGTWIVLRRDPDGLPLRNAKSSPRARPYWRGNVPPGILAEKRFSSPVEEYRHEIDGSLALRVPDDMIDGAGRFVAETPVYTDDPRLRPSEYIRPPTWS